MKQLSNGYGSVTIEDNYVYGWRSGGRRIGDLPLPLNHEDALAFVEMCLAEFPGDGTFKPGITASILSTGILRVA